jgi:hypothetical protein
MLVLALLGVVVLVTVAVDVVGAGDVDVVAS